MSDLYPLLLKPISRASLGDARSVAPYIPEPGEEPIGEVWLTGEENRVANGPLAGMSLGELSASYGRDLVGEAAPEIAFRCW